MGNVDEKKRFRLKALARRDSLSPERRSAYSKAMIKELTFLPCYRQADAILTYISFRSEVETGSLLEQAFADGKAVFAPRVLGQEMAFFQIDSGEDLVEGYHGIREPEGGMPYTDWVSQHREAQTVHTLVCLPGAAFDRRGHRIGYGGGFYDRYLDRLLEGPERTMSRTATAALAFACQIFEEIPWEAHDICPEWIVTEREVIRCK